MCMSKLREIEFTTLENAFNTGNGVGYVLDFSDRTFAIYFDEEFKVDIFGERYFVNGGKAKRLRKFIETESDTMVSRVLRSLWDYRAAIIERQGKVDTQNLTDRYFQIVHKLEGDIGTASTDAIERFSNNETLDELVSAIQRDITANKPQAALDRLHTYCMKKFAHLLDSHGQPCNHDVPLHSRVGLYVKLLKDGSQIQDISLTIMKSSNKIFEEFNNIRNNKTFAHDNDIVGLHEARFIFDSISSILRFIRSIEASRFGG